ncbi:MAG TPA: lipopolysaccharide assembly protein LapA domain-containing protein [Steroidobacteraceae bacterium]|jgi:uncharacterized integral membrane protein
MSRFLFLLSVTIAALLAVLVSAMNAAGVDIELAFFHVAAPLGIALVVAFTIGMLAGLLWRAHWMAELLRERGRLRRALRLAESQARNAAAAGDKPV